MLLRYKSMFIITKNTVNESNTRRLCKIDNKIMHEK